MFTNKTKSQRVNETTPKRLYCEADSLNFERLVVEMDAKSSPNYHFDP